MKFSEFKLNDKILGNLKEEGYESPTEIQEQVIPICLEGKDILGCAQTGTGKTASFALPIIHLIASEEKQANERRDIKYLVLTPTRELAMQIFENFKKYARGLNQRFVSIYGGSPRGRQISTIKEGVDVAICTPGRLLDLIQSKKINVSLVKTIVLDEADIMLDMGFIDDVKRIISYIPKEHQTLFFSATMPKGIKLLVDKIMKPNYENVIIAPSSSTLDLITQLGYCVDRQDKKELLLYLIDQNAVELAIIFVRTKSEADSLDRFLRGKGIQSCSIHGDKEQRQRDRIIREFKQKRIQILVATDVASRGIDVSDVSHVFNYDLPDSPETYVHRIGRTGRAKKTGTAISIYGLNEKSKMARIHKTIDKIIDNKLVDMAKKEFTPLAIGKDSSSGGSSSGRSRSGGGNRGRGGYSSRGGNYNSGRSGNNRSYRGDSGDRGFGDRRNDSGDRRRDSGDRGFGDRRNDSGDRRNDSGDRRNDSGDRRNDSGDRGFRDRRRDSGDRDFGDRKPRYDSSNKSRSDDGGNDSYSRPTKKFNKSNDKYSSNKDYDKKASKSSKDFK